jgi:hypothetical protein
VKAGAMSAVSAMGDFELMDHWIDEEISGDVENGDLILSFAF